MCLSRDQRAVLEAVYAMEKLPDADLRERLSAYLNLSTRQVQVWFQNRRQRAKANGPKKTVLNTSGQIMDAFLDFSGDSAARLALGDVLQSACARSAKECSSGSSSGSMSAETGGIKEDEHEGASHPALHRARASAVSRARTSRRAHRLAPPCVCPPLPPFPPPPALRPSWVAAVSRLQLARTLLTHHAPPQPSGTVAIAARLSGVPCNGSSHGCRLVDHGTHRAW